MASYYAIIPATVRHDKKLSDKTKLLYVEIFSLVDHKLVCSLSNKYFAEIFGVSEHTISKAFKNLANNGYIKLEYNKAYANSRKIHINQANDKCRGDRHEI